MSAPFKDTGSDLHRPFQLDEWQRNKLAEWLQEHDKTCPLARYSGAIGGRLSVTFTPTSIECFATAECACKGGGGYKVNLTDYDAL